jgi:hypothetical protein
VSDVEHQLLLDNADHLETIARLRAEALRAARAAIAAQDRADGTHEPWLDDLVRELTESIDA